MPSAPVAVRVAAVKARSAGRSDRVVMERERGAAPPAGGVRHHLLLRPPAGRSTAAGRTRAAPRLTLCRAPRPRTGGGGRRTLEMYLSEYKVVNGIKLPHLMTRGTNGETAEEWVIKSYRINPTSKRDTFTK